jgi:hypothetical protein
VCFLSCLMLRAPAFVRRDGAVLADAWLPDLARLGELEAHLGYGVIEDMVSVALAEGRLPRPVRRRIMSYPLVIRLMIAMALMPDASYCEALSRLAGPLADIPFTRDWHIPTEKVITGWRLPVPPSLMEALFWQAAGPLAGDDGPSAVMLAGMPVAGANGMLVSVADTAVNRDFFGTTGTGNGSSPFPQLRVVALIARAGRAMLRAILGQASAGEQTLLKRLVKRRPDLFRGLVICFDRNFPGHDLITAILDAGGHVIARVKAGIALPFEDGPARGWLADGSRMTWLNAPTGKKQDRLPVRAAEHNVVFPAGCGKDEVSETCTIITTLLDHEEAPAGQCGRPTSPGGAPRRPPSARTRPRSPGPGTAPPARCCGRGCPRLVIQEAWAWLTGTQLTRASLGRRAGQRARRCPRAAPQGRPAGHGRRGILHRRLAPRRPLHDNHAAHRHVIAGRDRRRGRVRSPCLPAHPEHSGPAAAL